MKKRFIFIVVLIAAIGVIYLFTSKKAPAPAKVEYYKEPAKGAELLYEKAEKLVKEEKLLDAARAYKKLLAQHPGSNMVKDARAKLDSLNIRTLFSAIPTEDSVSYEVKPGDTLSKIAKDFGTTVELIMKSNGLADSLIRPGMRLKVSRAAYSILVDKSQNILILRAGNEVFKTYAVSTGADNSTPSGSYNIKNKLIDPTWYKTGAIVPPDSPENILGSRWMGLTLPEYGIHGTTDDSTIGMQITAGCIRMKNKDAEELFSIVPVGTPVTIID